MLESVPQRERRGVEGNGFRRREVWDQGNNMVWARFFTYGVVMVVVEG